MGPAAVDDCDRGPERRQDRGPRAVGRELVAAGKALFLGAARAGDCRRGAVARHPAVALDDVVERAVARMVVRTGKTQSSRDYRRFAGFDWVEAGAEEN